MQFEITHEVPGRMRVILAGKVPANQLDALYTTLAACESVKKSKVYPRIGSISITYVPTKVARSAVLAHLKAIDEAAIERAMQGACVEVAPRAHALLMDLALLVGGHFLRRAFLPKILSFAYTLFSYRKFLLAALRSLAKCKLDVPVLDAAAIGISFVKGDARTAALTMLLLNVGEVLEKYTQSRSEGALINALLQLPETAQLVEGNTERQVAANALEVGQLIAVRTGMPISVDGVVVSGSAMVNQSALTGEPLAISRSTGDNVFAGTSVESGEIIVKVSVAQSQTKLRSIVNMVNATKSCQSRAQSRMENMANKIVPWNFLLAGVVALTTRSLVKTSAALMVDFSCALKLTGSIAVLSAMQQSAKIGATVKGSKHLDNMACANTIVFDKTGTLTRATPEVAKVLTLGAWSENEVLRFAACLEEHFPHPVARAVVRAAAKRNLKHRERHAKVEYIVAHGIASALDGKRVVIGSEHFVVADEKVKISAATRRKISAETEGLSPLYLAVDGKLMGVIGVHDPLKPGTVDAIKMLKRQGFSRVIMLTGDNERTAARIAKAAGITEFKANLLPQDKYNFVKQLNAQGAKVVMVGDGVNDAPALALASVGIAMGQGTAVAKEVADITLTTSTIESIVHLRKLSEGLLGRLNKSYAQVMLINSGLLAAGIAGVITPQASSLLHNASTVALSLRNSRSYF